MLGGQHGQKDAEQEETGGQNRKICCKKSALAVDVKTPPKVVLDEEGKEVPAQEVDNKS